MRVTVFRFETFRGSAQAVRPVLTLIAEEAVVVTIVLPGQRLLHDRWIISAPDQPVAVLLQIFQRPDRFSELDFRKAPPLLAIANVLQNAVTLDENRCSCRSSRFSRSPISVFNSGTSHDMLSRLPVPNRLPIVASLESEAG